MTAELGAERRDEMNVFVRSSLWLADRTLPGMKLTGGGIVKVTVSDSHAALIRLSTDPLTIHGTRGDAIERVIDLMDQAATGRPGVPSACSVPV